ncbi:hypothetical protein JVT61DRAFT_14825 [Boletus reticuloceps]|uniref:Uncharacterized protein n=1 Tax=Boletus reticuloceps TaxID=495285 RepID=A0A8I3A3Z2_9AGAM|nr:hypothetical protein JVT61DRAFT_14825 [Boletus reticuloceps]
MPDTFHEDIVLLVKETLKFLVGLGCNPLQPSSQGDIPLCPSSTFGSSALNLKLTIIKVLVTAGCHTQIRNAAGLTPLDVAYSEGHFDVVDYLLTAPVPTDVSEE